MRINWICKIKSEFLICILKSFKTSGFGIKYFILNLCVRGVLFYLMINCCGTGCCNGKCACWSVRCYWSIWCLCSGINANTVLFILLINKYITYFFEGNIIIFSFVIFYFKIFCPNYNIDLRFYGQLLSLFF